MSASAASDRSVARALALPSLAILLLHAWWYRFLTDDAFISFRYARNLAEGAGLVFNPGYERVEGYTNFLWVIILAAFNAIGLAAETIANPLLALFGVLIWLLMSRYLRARIGPDGSAPARPLWILVAPLYLLAANRSFAVWCTSGLETKLFELLVVAGVLRAIHEIDAARAGGRESWIVSSLLLGLASLTRPDGLLISFCVMGARWLVESRRGAGRWRAAAAGVGVFAAIVGAHLAFRLAYYGDWVPNTYHAKVGGKSWWSMGVRYALTYAIEHGALFWLPLLAAAALTLRRERRLHHGLLFAAAVVPHALSLIAIGGDHFEYRPLDLYFPFVFLLLGDGATWLWARGRAGAAAAVALLALVAANMIAIPVLGRLEFPPDYRAGFPGAVSRPDGSRDLVSSERFSALFRVPLLKQTLDLYNGLVEATTRHGVGIRQEEHALFLPTVASEGRTLRELVKEGTLPEDTHIAIGSVGAIPYYSRLRTLDRLGLTDRVVAKGEGRPDHHRLMAHNKLASFDYAESAGVDLWSSDGTHLLFGPHEKELQDYARFAHERGTAFVAARAGSSLTLLAEVPGGPARAARRLPRLELAFPFLREAERPGAPWWVFANLGDLFAVRGQHQNAVTAFRRALEIEPDASRAAAHLGAVLLDTGEPEAALPYLKRAFRLDVHSAKIRADLVKAYARLGDFGEGIRIMRAQLALMPHNRGLAQRLARFLATCPDPSHRDPAEAIEIAERLRRDSQGSDAFILDTLASAYAAAERFSEAHRTALEAAEVALAVGDSTHAAEIRLRAKAYGEGRDWFEAAPEQAPPPAGRPPKR